MIWRTLPPYGVGRSVPATVESCCLIRKRPVIVKLRFRELFGAEFQLKDRYGVGAEAQDPGRIDTGRYIRNQNLIHGRVNLCGCRIDAHLWLEVNLDRRDAVQGLGLD